MISLLRGLQLYKTAGIAICPDEACGRRGRRVEDVLACTWHHVLDTSACLSDSDSPLSRNFFAGPFAHAGFLTLFADL